MVEVVFCDKLQDRYWASVVSLTCTLCSLVNKLKSKAKNQKNELSVFEFCIFILNYIQQYKSATQQTMPPDIQPGTQKLSSSICQK